MSRIFSFNDRRCSHLSRRREREQKTFYASSSTHVVSTITQLLLISSNLQCFSWQIRWTLINSNQNKFRLLYWLKSDDCCSSPCLDSLTNIYRPIPKQIIFEREIVNYWFDRLAICPPWSESKWQNWYSDIVQSCMRMT